MPLTLIPMPKAFAPGNLSCIFRICYNKDPAKMHSLGVGFTTDKGVIAEAQQGKKTEVIFNNHLIKFPTVITALESLTKKSVRIVIKSELPLGCGFGLSGACTLAAAYAVNNLFSLKKTEEELAMAAHTAEVINSTGLGDVAGQFNGGFLMKTKIGNPLEVERLDIKEKYVYYKIFGPLQTKGVLKNKLLAEKINLAGDEALKKIKQLKNPTLTNIIKISKEFAEKSSLLKEPDVINEIKKIELLGGAASMIMLGNAVYSDIEFPECEKAEISYRKAYVINATSKKFLL